MSTKRKKHCVRNTVQNTRKKSTSYSACEQNFPTDGITLQELFRLVGRDRLCEIYADYWTDKFAKRDGVLAEKSLDDLYAEFDHEASELVSAILDVDLIPSNCRLKVGRAAGREEPDRWKLLFVYVGDSIQKASLITDLYAHERICPGFFTADQTTRKQALEDAALIVMCWEEWLQGNLSQPPSLFDKLGNRSAWEASYVPIDSPEMDCEKAFALSTRFEGKYYTIVVRGDRNILYRINDSGASEPIASTDSIADQTKMRQLFMKASSTTSRKAPDIDTRSDRSAFGDFVRVRDLFRAIDHPDQLAWDVADWKMSESKSQPVDEANILRDRYALFQKARATITAIIESDTECDETVFVDDRDPDPMRWVFFYPDDLPGALTDLHLKVCPLYHTTDEGGDCLRETAAKMAASVILAAIL